LLDFGSLGQRQKPFAAYRCQVFYCFHTGEKIQRNTIVDAARQERALHVREGKLLRSDAV
jgi:hypothetical protein